MRCSECVCMLFKVAAWCTVIKFNSIQYFEYILISHKSSYLANVCRSVDALPVGHAVCLSCTTMKKGISVKILPFSPIPCSIRQRLYSPHKKTFLYIYFVVCLFVFQFSFFRTFFCLFFSFLYALYIDAIGDRVHSCALMWLLLFFFLLKIQTFLAYATTLKELLFRFLFGYCTSQRNTKKKQRRRRRFDYKI